MKEIKFHEYTGRTDDPNVKERIHQVIEPWKKYVPGGISLIGFCSDEGVKRNKGRTGQHLGPVHVKNKLAPLAYTGKLYEYGNILADEDLEGSQICLGEHVTRVLESKQFPIIIGGGHETLYGHYLGVRQYFKDTKIAVVNFDAHFDIRKESPSSGTMFYQILKDDKNIDYYVYGIEPASNTKTLFDTANSFGVTYVTMDDLRKSNFEQFNEGLSKLADYDVVFGTLCMDAVQQAVAPGTSAPSPNGFSSQEVHHMVEAMAQLDNLVSFDVSEVNPELDVDERTSRLAASIIYRVIQERGAHGTRSD
ncbi:formimidoylglutamase [Aliicoccus persicus]|uniref:Formimidoylglutamase n=1 Tax=Aliicoccus persicus TaxID=930138 RepID=A0A662Z005_9STAP|nr:formimidoylglutamase [Aliicoccus persicus]SEV79943.1 formiminoglutamase [Aliicoccus persicus]